MSHFIYADHAATTAVSDTALQAMLPHFTTAYGNPSSLYRFAQEGKTDLERARAEIAACLNARPEEIYFTSGGTEADNWALRGVAELMALKGRKGGHIITSTPPSIWRSRAMRSPTCRWTGGGWWIPPPWRGRSGRTPFLSPSWPPTTRSAP